MPKLIDKQTRIQIKEMAATKTKTQPEIAKHFGVSKMFVNALLCNRKIKRTRGDKCRMFI